MHSVIGVACMRKKILLLLATLAVATTLGRETSAVSASSDQTARHVTFLPLAFLPPTSGGRVAFLPPTSGGRVAFLPPTSGGRVAFLPPTSGGRVAFLPPTSGGRVAFLPPTSGGRVAFLPPTSGGHVAFLPPTSGGKVALADRAMLAGEPNASDTISKFAMLPLGAETGRHIRDLSEDKERNPKSDTAKSEATTPIAQFTRSLGTDFAMLPLGSEAGRHIRNLDQDTRQPEKTVAANAPKATA
jgi:hypothetical protein